MTAIPDLLVPQPARPSPTRRPARRVASWLHRGGPGLIVLVLVLAWSAVRAETAVATARSGLWALLSVDRDEAVLWWRFLPGERQPLDSISVTLNGAPLADPRFAEVANAAEPPPIVILLDTSRSVSAQELQQDRARVLRFWQRAQSGGRSVQLAAYADGPARLLPQEDPAGLLAGLQTQDANPNLGTAIKTALAFRPETPWRRLGLYVFTDGRGASELDIPGLARAALVAGTAITFVITPGSRVTTLGTLRDLAAKTGGFLIADESAFAALLREPAGLLDTGGMLRYPLKLGTHYPWDDRPILEANLSSAGETITLRLRPDMREAGWFESLGVLLDAVAGLILLLLLVAVLAVAGMRLVRRRRRSAAAPVPPTEAVPAPPAAPAEPVDPSAMPAGAPAAPDPVPAVPAASLENLGDGTVYPLRTRAVRVGRGRDSDIRLSDETVSRAHAVLVRDGETYRVDNLSDTNPIYVNKRPCRTAALTDGDILALGATRLRFRCAS